LFGPALLERLRGLLVAENRLAAELTRTVRQCELALRAALAPCVHHGFRIERQPDGRWRTWRPDGSEIHIHPPLDTAA